MSNYLGFNPSNNSNYYFVSYNSEDVSLVGKITSAMSSLGVSLWYDYGIEYGDNWETTIAEKIKDSQAVILFFTKGILHKNDSYVQKEYKMASRIFKKKIYVVMLDQIDDEDVPVSKASWWIDINEKQCVLGYKFADVSLLAEEIATSFNIPKDLAGQNDPAETYMKYGEFYMDNSPKYARESYRMAIDTYEKDAGNLSEKLIAKLALAHSQIGRSCKNEGRHEDALEYAEKALQLYENLTKKF